MKVLVAWYHPVSESISDSFATHLKFSIDCAVKTDIFDHYGSHKDLLKKNQEKYQSFKSITWQQGLLKLKQKQYDLLVVDGVYNGEKELIEIANQNNIPVIYISGYPYLRDEVGAKNILSFSWFLPQMQFINQFPTEGRVKQYSLDSLRKNVLVWYPEFQRVKKYAKENPRLLSAAYKNPFVSFIHRFEECNERHFAHYKNIIQKFGEDIPNYTNLAQEEVMFTLNQSRGLCLPKWADAPGIALIEAMLLGSVPFVFQQYILASFNQEVCIDGHSCVVSNSDDEFVENLRSGKWATLSESTQQHARMITDFKRQQEKLEKFIQECIK